MPPAQALVTSRSFSNDHPPTLNPTYVIWSLSFIFISGSFLAGRFIIRRRYPMYDNALLRTTFTLLTLVAREVWRARKRASSSPAVSTLVSQSTIVASSPLHLGIILNSGPPSISILRRSTDFLCRGLEQLLSWGRATIGLLCLAASTSAASIQQSFSNLICLNAASPDSRGSLSALHNTQVPGLFSSLHQRIGSNTKEHVESHRHLPGLTDELEPDLQVPDTINIPRILLSTDDARLKIETPVIPLIILSLPSSDHLVGDPPPVAFNEDLLSPDGTFRLTRQPVGAIADLHDINETTRLALASRLRERRKRLVSLPSLSVLGTSGMAQWPRWF